MGPVTGLDCRRRCEPTPPGHCSRGNALITQSEMQLAGACQQTSSASSRAHMPPGNAASDSKDCICAWLFSTHRSCSERASSIGPAPRRTNFSTQSTFSCRKHDTVWHYALVLLFMHTICGTSKSRQTICFFHFRCISVLQAPMSPYLHALDRWALHLAASEGCPHREALHKARPHLPGSTPLSESNTLHPQGVTSVKV